MAAQKIGWCPQVGRGNEKAMSLILSQNSETLDN